MTELASVQANTSNLQAPPLAPDDKDQQRQIASFDDTLAGMRAQDEQQAYETANHGRCLPRDVGEDGKQFWARCQQGAQDAKTDANQNFVKNWWYDPVQYLPESDKKNFYAARDANDAMRNKGQLSAYTNATFSTATGSLNELATNAGRSFISMSTQVQQTSIRKSVGFLLMTHGSRKLAKLPV